MKIGVILGSNSDIPGHLAFEPLSISTRYGIMPLWQTPATQPVQLGILLRHGPGHALLPHLVNHRGSLMALNQWGADLVVSFTVVGVLTSETPLAKPILFDDVFFPSNQLPDGNACTLFDQPSQPGRGHFLVNQPLSSAVRQELKQVLPEALSTGTYGHVFGPRFSTRSELNYLQSLGITAISQTSGPEFVLAGELKMPYALVGFGVDYALPDPSQRSEVADLNDNLRQWRIRLPQVLEVLLNYSWPTDIPFDQGYLYQIEADLPSS